MLIVIIIAIIVIFMIVKKKGANNQNSTVVQQPQIADRPTPGINRCPADALINSPYYSEYQTTFDLIWYNGKQPKYKIDWLLQSLNMGHKLENSGTYVIDSIENDLPYFCETGLEFSYFFNSEKPVLRGSIDGIFSMGCFYADFESNKEHSHPAKLQYWRQRLRELASSGNLVAQGSLCCRLAEIFFPVDEVAKFKKKYESTLFSLAKSGNAHAQLAVGKWLSSSQEGENIEWLTKAANQGLSDAWYELGHRYLLDTVNASTEEEKQALKRKSAECYYKAAEADNGVTAAYCQNFVGGYYEDGDSIFPKDIEKAKYWYQKAAKNGNRSAKRNLDYINEHPESY